MGAGEQPGRDPARLCVMLSGGGRSLVNILNWIDRGQLEARVVLVIASRECKGAEHARERGLEVAIEPGEIPADRLGALLDRARVDWVILAGYIRFVNIPARYTGRIVNIHPALLPEFGGRGFYGHRVHEAVLAARRTESGCTVHIVDEEYDHGPIVLQKRCRVEPGDTPETLAARVFELERQALPEAIQRLIDRGRDS